MAKYKVLNKSGDYILDSNIMVEGEIGSAGSKMLKNYKSPFSSTIHERLEENDYKLYGIGSNSEFSLANGDYGSVDAVSEGAVRLGIGTDTGGNLIRALGDKGLNGFIPSTGLISSYGLIKGTSSFTRPGIFGGFEEIREAFNIVSGIDEKDPMSTSLDKDIEFYDRGLDQYRVGIYQKIDSALISFLDKPMEIELANSQYIDSVFDVIASVEVAANTARYDGIRYGYRTEDYEDMDDLYGKTRAEGFSLETKKAIIKGNLYAGYSYERLIYEQALKLRMVLLEEIVKTFEEFDILIAKADSNISKLASLTNRPVVIRGDLIILADYKEDEEALNFASKMEEVING